MTSKIHWSAKWAVMKSCLKIIWNWCMLFYLLYNIKKKNAPASSFLYCLQETVKFFNKCFVCNFHYLKTILNQWLLLIYNIGYNKKSLLLQLVACNIYAILKTVYCFNWSQEDLLEADTKRCFLMQVKSENIETVHWKSQWRPTIKKHALLWNKNEYQHSADISVKNQFYATGIFQSSLKSIRKLEISLYFRRDGMERDQCHEVG